MNPVPRILPLSELRRDATGIIKSLAASPEPLVITRRGRAAAVVMSMQTYEHTHHQLEILRLLARGEQEIERGVGFDMDSVLAEADKLLGEL